MANVARELVTRLSFVFNRQNLDRFERSVQTFKKNIVTTVGDVRHFVGQIVDYFVDIGKAPIQLQNIASAAGITTKELLAMQNAAIKFGISTENFQTGFSRISSMLQQAKRGFGPFFDLLKTPGLKFTLPSPFLTDLQNLEKFTDELYQNLQGLSKAEQIYGLEKFLTPEAAVEWQRAFAKGPQAFKEMYQYQLKITDDVDNQAEKFRQFATEAEILGNEVKQLLGSIFGWIIPAATSAVRGANAIIEDVPKFHEQGGGGFFGFLKEIASAPFELAKLYAGGGNTNNTPINTHIEINVPPGTLESQIESMGESVREAIEQVFQYKSREIMNNNPQVE